MSPFVILSLPRTGTSMLVDALASHPDITQVRHEFRGSEESFWLDPHVLSNYLHDWMIDDRIKLIHVAREDAVAGAKSMLLMHYTFPDRSFDIPSEEVRSLARCRQELERKFAAVAHYRTSYEALTRGKELRELPYWFAKDFCDLVGIRRHKLTVTKRKNRKVTPRNDEELTWLPG